MPPEPRQRGWPRRRAGAAAGALVLGVGLISRVLAAPPGEFGRDSAAPDPRSAGESTSFAAPRDDALLARHGISAPRRGEPSVRVDDHGAVGDGVADDTAALRRALRALPPGGTLVFTAGKTYRKTDLLVVNRPGVRLWGYGAVLYSVVTDRQLERRGEARIAVHLDAPRTAVYGLTFVSNMRGRPVGHPHVAGVWLSSEDQELIDNRLEYTNIFVRKAQRFVVARNVVYRSTADGIHVTTGSRDGKIVGNVVRQTGDDMIAVVSYGLGEPSVGRVLIADNDVSAQYWGRGIAVVGGHDVQIRNNKISRTPFGAAILVHSETSYKTSNVRNVLVESNQIRDVQTARPEYNPAFKWKKTGHGAIDVYGQGEQQVSHVIISGNSIENADRDAILVRGNACEIDIAGNELRSVGRDAVRVEIRPRAGCRVRCKANRVSGRARVDAACAAPIEAKQ